MFEFLLIMTFWQWVLVAAVVVTLGVSAAMENTLIAGVSFVIYGILAWLFFGVNPIAWVIASPGSFLLVCVLYLFVGVGWSLFRWRDHMLSDEIQSKIEQGQRAHQGKGGRAEDFRASEHFPAKAEPGYHKERILSWIALWPFSVFIFAFDDLLARFFSRLYATLAGTYESLTNRYIP